jgi:tetratricopeptide (TPR) repeat protein
MSRTLAVALALTAAARVAAAADSAGAPSASDVDIAKAHFATGQAYYEHSRFADAAHEFEEAYRLSHKPPLLYNVGKSYDGADDYARALDAYRRFLDAAPADNPDRATVQKRVQLLATLVGTIALHGARDGSAVAVDGAPVGTTPLLQPLVANPGRHNLLLTHERAATFRRAVDVPVGGVADVAVQQVDAVKVVTLAEPAPAAKREKPVYQRWWLWTAVGGAVVVAGVITAVVLTTGSSDSGPTVHLPTVR